MDAHHVELAGEPTVGVVERVAFRIHFAIRRVARVD